MKVTVVLIVLLVTLMVLYEAEARRCRWKCRRYCYRSGWKYRCRFRCRRVCRGKREAAIENQGHMTSLPANFDFYDLNDDNFIELEEFAGTLGEEVEETDLVLGFNVTDVNHDGKISREEFISETSAFVIAEPFPELDEHGTLPNL